MASVVFFVNVVFPEVVIFCSELCVLSVRAPLIMTHTLTGFMELMDHGIVSWENLSAVFIKKVGSSTIGFFNLSGGGEIKICQEKESKELDI